MIKALLRRRIAAFETGWGYDAGYMNDLLALGPWTLIRFGLVASLGHSAAAPGAALAAARIVGTLSGDCGPCTQLTIDMAEKGGVRPEVLPAILVGDLAAMGETAALGYRFARAALDRDLETGDAARAEITRRWGGKAVTALGLALTTAQMYPTVKYSLGHGRTCSRVTVAGTPTPFSLAEPIAV
ncbi:MAG: hypothetical protein Q8L66_10310 [Caulobacter sp.]|nr:hypothetical protein [Caulobacter sp.]